MLTGTAAEAPPEHGLSDNAPSQFVCGATAMSSAMSGTSQHRLSPAPTDSCRKRVQSQRKQVCSTSHLSRVSA